MTTPAPEEAHTLASIIAEVSYRTGISVTRLLSEQRRREISWPRQEIYARAIDAGLSTPKIGKLMGRDHSTILYGAKQFSIRTASP